MKIFSTRLFLLIFTLSLVGTFTSLAEAPAGYYATLDGKKEGTLKAAIHNRIRNFTLVSSYNNLPNYFKTTDVYPGTNRWWDMYSDETFYLPSFKGMNREHSLPKSWWGGNTDVSAYVDLNHLYPSEANANMAKSNYPLGVVDTNSKLKFNNGVTKVGYPINGQGGGASFVFEPDDRYKGDFARTYFYMATCYTDLTWKYTYMLSNNDYPTLNQWSIKLLMDWHRNDPVSQKEIDRNEEIYKYQNNRNPFIDHPELAEYLWGNKVGEVYQLGGAVEPPLEDAVLIAPTRDMDVQLGEVAIGESVTARLYFKGENLRSALDLSLYSTDKEMFSIPTSTIPASLVNSEDGYWLSITYRPTAIGAHTAKIAISEGGLDGSIGIALHGECFPVPTLPACTALAPSDIESDRYVANWTVSTDELIDGYIVTRTMYRGSEVVTEELSAEDTHLEIRDFDKNDSEAYSVQSVRLGHRSPMSNIVFVSHSGVTGVEVNSPLIVRGFDGFIRFICSEPQSACKIFDISGKLVKELDSVEQNMDVEMPLGVYFVITNEHTTPIKVIVKASL